MKSWLFFSTLSENHIRSANNSNADVLVYDLEDSVLLKNKSIARERLYILTELISSTTKPVYVRINCQNTKEFEKDIDTCIKLNIKNIVYPKCNSSNEIQELQLLDFNVVPIIETINGYFNVEPILKTGVEFLIFGSFDFLSDMDILPFNKEAFPHALVNKISIELSIVCKLYNAKFIDCSTEYYEEDDLFEKECRFSFEIGAFGKVALHPRQVKIINSTFRNPLSLELFINESFKILSQLSNCMNAVTSVSGKIIGPPIVRQIMSKAEIYIREKETCNSQKLQEIIRECKKILYEV